MAWQREARKDENVFVKSKNPLKCALLKTTQNGVSPLSHIRVVGTGRFRSKVDSIGNGIVDTRHIAQLRRRAEVGLLYATQRRFQIGAGVLGGRTDGRLRETSGITVTVRRVGIRSWTAVAA